MDGFRDTKLIEIKEVKEWNDNKKLLRTTNELDGKRKWEKQQSEIAEQEASLLSHCCCLNLLSQFTWSVSLCGLQGFFKVPVFGQGNQKQRNQCPYFVPHVFLHGQDWARPAFHQPPLPNSLHPRAQRRWNSPQHSTHGWRGTSSSLSCTKISFFSRGLSTASHITNWADEFSTPCSPLIPLPRWSSQELNLSLLYPLKLTTQFFYCRKGFTFCIRLL